MTNDAADVESCALVGADGDALRAVFVAAASAVGEAPEPAPDGAAVLFVHDVFGIDAWTLASARRLAEAGYPVLVPDLFSRERGAEDDVPSDPEQLAAARAALPDRRALRDLEAAAVWLAERPDVDERSLAVVGFGLGGGLAFQVGCTSTRLAVVVDLCGDVAYDELSAAKPIQPIELTLNLDRPLLALFAEADELVPQAHVELLRERLASSSKDFELVIYPGAARGFLDERRQGYHAGHAADAWSRVLTFLAHSL